MKVEKRQHSINRFFRFVNIFPIVFFIFFVAVNSFFTINYVLGHGRIFIILLISFSFFMLAVYIIFAVFCYKRFQMVFVRGLYSTTVFNLKNIVDNDNPLYLPPDAVTLLPSNVTPVIAYVYVPLPLLAPVNALLYAVLYVPAVNV